MAGVSVDGAKGARRSLDSEINMIPMIDLLMVTISFLLITAVWVQSQRLAATGMAPGSSTEPCEGDCKEEPRLHIETADDTKFVLAWKQGRTVLRSTEVEREVSRERKVAFHALASKVASEWRASGSHQDATDHRHDQAVVHAANEMPYSDLVAVMDAIGGSKRDVTTAGQLRKTPAFEVILATD